MDIVFAVSPEEGAFVVVTVSAGWRRHPHNISKTFLHSFLNCSLRAVYTRMLVAELMVMNRSLISFAFKQDNLLFRLQNNQLSTINFLEVWLVPHVGFCKETENEAQMSFYSILIDRKKRIEYLCECKAVLDGFAILHPQGVGHGCGHLNEAI